MIRIIRSELLEEDVPFAIRDVGKIWKLVDGSPIVICGEGLLKITEAIDGEGNQIHFVKLRSRFY